MRGVPNYWVPFGPDYYLDRRQADWLDEERQHLVRYYAGQRVRLVYVHQLDAPPRLIAALGRPNAAGAPERTPGARPDACAHRGHER